MTAIPEPLTPAEPWTGRDDGPGTGPRWHQVVTVGADAGSGPVLIGFRSDEGVRRNQGRPGAVDGPAALRGALAPLAVPEGLTITDLGDVVVDTDLETGQRGLGAHTGPVLGAHRPVVVLGGGHEVARASYLGLRAGGRLDGRRLGVLNLDAHFDLRRAERATSGTPFRQIAEDEQRAGRRLDYLVLGIARSANSSDLFATADRIGAEYRLDLDCQQTDQAAIREQVGGFLDRVDVVHLTVDLDCLPAAVAPGVSAPAGFGIPLTVLLQVVAQVARSGRLALLDIAELNPLFDQDSRTARTAARIIHEVVTNWAE
ncbi:formimidoylglutamase [Enemella evansiae]|uniref:formimidoylglutamase n=1 Tax=Enemella evansiae TaxID=2016499 RepID=UPI000B95DBF2|nr:formimidoylglutamase [Enemella evansiae]OYN95119.1 formimidoylglutamase [Enemella evansiae]